MRKWLRRIRGAIGMGITWALAWGFVGGIPRWIFGIRADAPFGIVFAVLGFIAGVAFSAVLVVADGRRTFEQMSMRRFAGWGAVGGIVLSAIFTKMASLGLKDVLVIVPTFAVASAICASGSLALARKATRPELPDVADTRRVRPGGS
jgi:hypothetical protein